MTFFSSKLGFKTLRLVLLPFSKACFVNCKNLHIPCCEACHLKRTSEESSCLIPPHVSKYSSKANFCYKLFHLWSLNEKGGGVASFSEKKIHPSLASRWSLLSRCSRRGIATISGQCSSNNLILHQAVRRSYKNGVFISTLSSSA
jgi:hypothetical protein